MIRFAFFIFCSVVVCTANAHAFTASSILSKNDKKEAIIPHKAVYKITMTSKNSGSRLANIDGKMAFDLNHSCAGWISSYDFDLRYEYVDAPGLKVQSDFDTFESLKGDEFSFSTQRSRNDELYETIQGNAFLDQQDSRIVFSQPDNLTHIIGADTLFPIQHTKALIDHAQNKQNFFQARVYDGGDSEKPKLINNFIGKKMDIDQLNLSNSIKGQLKDTASWSMRLAAFSHEDSDSMADYEMTVIFHDNGVVSDMDIDYGSFSIRQELVELIFMSISDCPIQGGN